MKNNTEIKKFTVKKMLKAIFKKQQKAENIYESTENDQNMEIAENAANNKISEYEEEEEFVPVNFVRTDMGTVFFIQPAHTKELPVLHFQDRWAQA